jgi:hypothetical protein
MPSLIRLSRYQSSPGEAHFKALQTVLLFIPTLRANLSHGRLRTESYRLHGIYTGWFTARRAYQEADSIPDLPSWIKEKALSGYSQSRRPTLTRLLTNHRHRLDIISAAHCKRQSILHPGPIRPTTSYMEEGSNISEGTLELSDGSKVNKRITYQPRD